ncbi:MAG: adenine-specific methyltransferase EcoRI family protein [Bacteroidales bacterium]|nr:adenine-specific methyltransferase EcoRI family protein [Bacteroidales bacterium]
MANKSLHAANKAKQDEFYTQLCDIERELRHYRKHFNGKVILCNCDDPYESNFFKYFAMNFNSLGLKKLIATCYDGSPVAGTQFALDLCDDANVETTPHCDVSTANPQRVAHKIVITEVTDMNGDGAINLADVEYLLKNDKNVLTKLKGNGDFRSEECIALLKEADIVVTNPPFSLFREYLAQLIEYQKSFLIIGNQNAITYKEVFKLIKENKIWLGFKSGHTLFEVPQSYSIPDFYDKNDKSKLRSNGYIVDENGKLWRNLGNICWFTNLDHSKRHEDIDLYKTYNPEEYPAYDNYPAINCDLVADIPTNYEGIIGVPISFLDKYNPEQFEIIGLGNSRDNFTPNKDYINPKKVLKDGKIVNGGAINCVLAIEIAEKPTNTIYYTSDNSKYLLPPYARILIRRKQ